MRAVANSSSLENRSCTASSGSEFDVDLSVVLLAIDCGLTRSHALNLATFATNR